MTTKPFSRRQVLRAGAMAAGAAMMPFEAEAQTAGANSRPAAAGPGAAPKMAGPNPNVKLKQPTDDAKLPIRLGLATYTFRNFDSAKLVEFAKQLKTPYLNLKDMHLPLTPLDQVKAKADAYRAQGFTLVAAGNITFAKDDDDDIRPKFEYAKAAGIKTLVCIPTHENLKRLEKFVREYDVKLAIHNHGPEQKDFPSPFDVLKAIQNLDHRIGLCIDLGHSLRAGADVIAAIHAAGPRLYDLHIKDLADANSRESQVAVGEGIMPVRRVFEALMATKYPGTVDLEYEINAKDPMPGVVESFAYMRGVLAGMGYK
ncbi:MAG TPA: sugar phosphate isomerase/epimerase family protein [Acidobacteriaceae bacterium]|nr:sugar phosphate isomerase/epimerase family protein [Acidobacteriaceae bacterium]